MAISAQPPSGLILVRATAIDARVLAFADSLETASGLPAAFVLDGRGGPFPNTSQQQILLTAENCAALGLFCPDDFTWRCGDYGFYAARERFPEADFFWMIEHDVRFAGASAEEFFTFFANRTEIDFLATHFRTAGLDWPWEMYARSRNYRTHRCLFPVVRLSEPAVRALHAKRREHSRQALRRVLWPNDESFVGTTLANGNFSCHDLNDFGRTFYDEETFSFHTPIDGESFAPDHEDIMLYHPVLFGAAYSRKLALLESYKKPAEPGRREPMKIRLARKINRYIEW